jgi:hypothetical protein
MNVKFPKQLEEELNERNKRKSYKWATLKI